MDTIRLDGVLQMRRFAADSGERIALYELANLDQPGTTVYRRYP